MFSYKSLIAVPLFAVTLPLLWKLIKKKLSVQDPKYFYNVVFFPDKGLLQRQLIINDRNNDKIQLIRKEYRGLRFSSSLIYLVEVIESAKESLDISILIFSLSDVAEAVVKAKNRNVKVRLMVDRTMADCDGSCIPRLQRNDIYVLRGPSRGILHHKFLLADCKLISEGQATGTLVTGSFNWTWSAVTCNYENLLITNNSELNYLYLKEFQKMWNFLQTI